MILTGAIKRGLDFEGVKQMELGQIVDYCIEFNKANEKEYKDVKQQESKPKARKATQADWDAFFG